jgi:glyoxylase I family protein
LAQHEGACGASFDRTTAGLDHVALACAGREQMAAWAAHLDRLGIAPSRVQDPDYGSALSFTDSDGNALEFFASA